MSCQDPTLRIIECAQALIHGPVHNSGQMTLVSSRMLEDLRHAYAEWLYDKRREPLPDTHREPHSASVSKTMALWSAEFGGY